MTLSVTQTLTAALEEARARTRLLGRPVLASLSEPITRLDPLAIFAAAQAAGLDSSFWQQPAGGFALVGVGEAVALEPSGAGRIQAARDAWRDLLADALVAGDEGAGPALLGGFAFDPERPRSELWRGFPGARLVLPRLLYSVTLAGCWRTTSLLVDRATDVADEERRLAAESALLERADAAPNAAPNPARQVEARPGAAWRGAVARGVAAIRAGELEKVVLARAVLLEAERAFAAPAALARLAVAYPSCTVFAFGRAGRTFLGATPERLARLEDGVLRTAALAGSAPRGATPEEDARLGQGLLASAKDRGEHAIVVRALTDGLEGICDELTMPGEPALLSVANIHHLHTPVSGRLGPGKTLLDAVERLHPTPAVGGWPRAAALRFIREQEGLDRGWYAAPLGWLDRHGAGEFAVGLRSALLEGSTATLFAGCGIVGDSDPAEEYAESRLKLRPMLAALTGCAR